MNGPINVVVMGNFLYPRGMAECRRIQHAIDALRENPSVTIQVLLLRQSHVGRDGAALDGTHLGTPYRTIGHDLQPGWKLVVVLPKYFLDGFRFLGRARRRGAKNILYVYMDPNIENVAFIFFARLLGYKVIFDITEDYYYAGRNAHLPARIKAWTVSFFTRHIGIFADAVFVISSHLQRKFEALSRGRFLVRILPISVNMEQIPVRNGSLHRPLRVLYAGSFGDKDPVEVLIDAVNSLCGSGSDIELLLAGRGLPDRMTAIMDRISASPHRGRMRYLGYLSDDDYHRLLSECDVPCMIRSRTHYAGAGFPFKLGEYLASGKPTIATRIGDVDLYLQDRINALLVGPESVESVMDALRFVLDNPERSMEIGARGRDIAAHNFDAKIVGQLVRDIVEQI
jgi:glycosyltransferase involved in cell wall biosynthesis